MNKYTKAIERMVELVHRDHGGCEEEGCAISEALTNSEISAETLIWLWAGTGAADSEFLAIYRPLASKINAEAARRHNDHD